MYKHGPVGCAKATKATYQYSSRFSTRMKNCNRNVNSVNYVIEKLQRHYGHIRC